MSPTSPLTKVEGGYWRRLLAAGSTAYSSLGSVTDQVGIVSMFPDFTSYPAHITSDYSSRNIDAQLPSISPSIFQRRCQPPKRLPFMSTHWLMSPARKAYERGRIVGGKRATVVDNVGVGGGMVDDGGLEVLRDGAVRREMSWIIALDLLNVSVDSIRLERLISGGT
ncbi:hypothetical protein BDQ17DRAFT_1327462 [Cyathus striatus]|nr:hypothetical protein BDQ17DRAFT_1327462 [Cyathus striatus]